MLGVFARELTWWSGRYVRAGGLGVFGMRWGAAGKQPCLMTAGAVQSISCDLKMCQSCPGTAWGGLSAPRTPSVPPNGNVAPGLGMTAKGLTQSTLGERWGHSSKAPTLLFLFL